MLSTKIFSQEKKQTMKKLLVLFVLLSTISISQVLAGGGWPQPKGKGYIKLSQWWLVSNQHFTDTGLIDPNVTSGVFNTSLYLEYGITNRLTVTGYIPFFSRATNNNLVSATTGEILSPGDAINSFGDTDLGLTYGLTKGTINTSASLILGLPLGNDAGGSQLNLQTGDGEFNQLVKVDAGFGYQVGKTSAYANVYAGYNNRSNGFSDEFRFGAETGYNLFGKKILAIVRVFGVLSTFNGDTAEQQTSTSIFANNAEHITISPELNYNINKSWGVSASVATALYGRLIFASPAYSVGVYARF